MRKGYKCNTHKKDMPTADEQIEEILESVQSLNEALESASVDEMIDDICRRSEQLTSVLEEYYINP